ncbi:hypothetical protein RGQ29_011206 [Quercus rubra]|uniref:TTF-type domain-containing protein n=1 Tax=Quercus rubra TaxID=3512 RepID=A0AAN7J7D4_QUERU|nr:hypothetical protein RGQ29_011206 [Quercus rubra]
MSSLQLELDPGLHRQIYTYHVDQRDEIRRRYIKLGPYQPHDRFKPWLEYSPKKDAAFCLSCFLFHKPTGHDGQNAFTVNGFKSWKKVKNDLNSTHRMAHKACLDLMNQSQHIDRVASIDVVRHLSLQVIAFRGRDESSTSTNRGNFLTTLDLMVGYNNDIVEIMAKAPKNATYTSPQIQKEILHVISTKVKKAIRQEIGDAKFCILVDEARDESMKEQMAMVLRYVDINGFVRERFFGIVHVVDTTAVTLKKEIYYLFSNYCLDIQNIRGQGYDGASNMQGEWNGLQTLILNDYPYAYYIHLGASKAVVPLNRFFTKLILVINNSRASCKRVEQLKIARAFDIAYLFNIEELETGKGLNQMVTLQRPGDTRWGSHYKSVSNLMKLFSPTCEVLLKIMDEGNSSQKVEAESAYEVLISFEFIFILHFVNETMGITDKLCQALQNQSQDILNAMHLVSSTKKLIQQFRDEKWDDLLATVISFCKKRGLDVPDMNAHNFYPIDFTDDEKNDLKKELDLYKNDVVQYLGFKNLKNISELCQWMVRTRKLEYYPLIYRVVKLVLTLPVSTATIERAFSAMNVIKTNLRNKMEDEFLSDTMMLFIERDIAATISTDSIIDDFEDLKRRRVPFS